nr:PREDICTED: elongation of very long chain fatty acids protein 7-like [Linepithema humile]
MSRRKYIRTALSRSGLWYFLAKVTELLDTVFMVLRKKQNQLTFLHVYHHTVTVLVSWCYLKLLPGEQGVVVAFLNSVVHIIMYSYYFIAALGSKYKKYIWWKKYMTCIQLYFILFYNILSHNFTYCSVLQEISCSISLNTILTDSLLNRNRA